jgi:hypothetical protein
MTCYTAAQGCLKACLYHLAILELKLELLSGIYALFIYRKRAKSCGFSYVEVSDMIIDDMVGFVEFF